jgi:type I restriction enzyme M protein
MLREAFEQSNALLVQKEKIAASGDYNLTGERYRVVKRRGNQKWPMVRLGDETLFDIEAGGTPDSKNDKYWNGDIAWATLVDLPQNDYISVIKNTERKITEAGLKNSSAKLIPENSVIVSTRATIGRIGINRIPLCTNQGFKNIIIKDTNRVNLVYLAYMLKPLVPKMQGLASGGTFKEILKTNFCSLEIPLPPLPVQQEIVAQIESEQSKIEEYERQIKECRENIDSIVNKVWEE